jgi:hypothetical protein
MQRVITTQTARRAAQWFALVVSAGCSDGLVATTAPLRDAAAHDDSTHVSADAGAADDATPVPQDAGPSPNTATSLDGSASMPEGGFLALLEAGLPFPDARMTYPCETRLSGTSFPLDAGDCAARPAQPCQAKDAARAAWLVEPSDFISDELFKECGNPQALYSVGVAFNAEGCAERFVSLPFPASDMGLQCYLHALQTRRYPCSIRCSEYFPLQ